MDFLNRSLSFILRNTLLYFVAQIALTTLYWQSGLTKLFHFSHTMELMRGWGLTPAWLFTIITIIVQLAGSILIIFGRRWAILGAAILIVFTIGTMLAVQDFWNASTLTAYNAEKSEFIDHITLIGGLMISAIVAEFRYGRKH